MANEQIEGGPGDITPEPAPHRAPAPAPAPAATTTRLAINGTEYDVPSDVADAWRRERDRLQYQERGIIWK